MINQVGLTGILYCHGMAGAGLVAIMLLGYPLIERLTLAGGATCI